MSLAELGLFTQGTALNVTTILLLIQRLTPSERAILFRQLGVTSEQGIMDWLSTKGKQATYEEQLLEYQDYRTHKLLVWWIPPILLVIGTIGNLLSFIILMQRSMRKSSTYIYLAVLSITDTLVLYVGLLRLWAAEITGYDIRVINWVCKVVNVAGYTVSDYSVWLIIAVTVERYIAVCHPLKAPAMCNRQRAIFVIAGLFVLLFSINSHYFWTASVVMHPRDGETIAQCEHREGFETLVVDVWPWVDAFIYSFLPFVVITILNALIIKVVVIARKQRSSLQSSRVYNEARRTRQQQESSYKLTLMLLSISFTFLLTTLPVNITLIATAFHNNDSLSAVAKRILVRTITELLMYANHSINFFLYCATGQRFRQQLVILFCRRRSRLNSEFQQTHRTQIVENGRSPPHSKAYCAQSAQQIQPLVKKCDKASPSRTETLPQNCAGSKTTRSSDPNGKHVNFIGKVFSFSKQKRPYDDHCPNITNRNISSANKCEMELVLLKDSNKTINGECSDSLNYCTVLDSSPSLG